MNLIFEFLKFIFYTIIIVVISKYLLVPVLRKLAESLSLSPKTVGNISGIATSVPELLTVCFSALTGLISASTYNIISSNVINLVQYLSTIFLNKNQSILSKKAIKIDLAMVILTIIIPILFFILKIDFSIQIVPMFFLLLLLFYFINNHSHKLYLNKVTEQEKQIQEEQKWIMGKKKIIVKSCNKNNAISNIILLCLIAILLYFIGNLLSDTLESLCIKFTVPQWLIGIFLGFITSIPELITFLESQKHYKTSKQNSEDGVIEATNNLLTSNIINLFVIQSIGIIIYAIFN